MIVIIIRLALVVSMRFPCFKMTMKLTFVKLMFGFMISSAGPTKKLTFVSVLTVCPPPAPCAAAGAVHGV
jgi:hypothetical protein